MKRFFALLSCLLLVFCISACGYEEAAEDILYRICSDAELPSGTTYLSGAPEGSSSYLAPDTLEDMYGDEAQEEVFSLVEEYAIYLSRFAKPYEVAVFKCYSVSDTDSVLEMCLERLESIKILLRDTEYAPLADTAEVYVDGKYVIMLVMGDL